MLNTTDHLHAVPADKSGRDGCVLASLAAAFQVLSNRLNESLSSLSKMKQMKTTRVTIKWHAGLHMRAAAQLVRLARRFRSSICLRVGSRVADARSILSIMILCASLGSPLDIEASGNDEHEAIQAMVAFFDDVTPME